MTFPQAVREIESPEFAGRVNIASGLGTLFAIIAREPGPTYLLRSANQDEGIALRLLRRALQRAQEDFDHRYENPWDTAIATFLWVVCRARPELSPFASEVALSLRQSWWTRKFAEYIAAQNTFSGDSLTARFELGEGHPTAALVRTDSSESDSLGLDHGMTLDVGGHFSVLAPSRVELQNDPDIPVGVSA